MENLEISHDILLAGSDFESCRKRVIRFFERTTLIRYDEVSVLGDQSLNGSSNEFRARLEAGLAANKKALEELVENLRDEGFTSLEDIQGLQRGYISKIFHTIAHLLDGFIGIDSCFYNFEEDSHGISRALQQKILMIPEQYWIIRVKGSIASAGEDPFHALRTFEWKGMDND
jgi:hypothetical protein